MDILIYPTMKKILIVLLGIFILSVCFAGCTQPSSPVPVAAQTPTVSQPVATQPVATQYIATQPVVTQSPIVGTWDLLSYQNGKAANQTVITGSVPTAVFGPDYKLSGSGGCNQYSAEYKTTASNGITITQPITTLMACPGPVMQQETQYLSLLQQATTYSISGDQLALSDKNGVQVLTYKKQVSIPSTVAGTWNLFSYNNGKGAIQTAITGSVTTAVFGSDLNLSGSGGCNRYSAKYTTTALKGITITQPASTKMACAEDQMQQETQYLSLLPTAAKFETSGDQLTLFNSTGTKILIYKSAGLKVNPLG